MMNRTEMHENLVTDLIFLFIWFFAHTCEFKNKNAFPTSNKLLLFVRQKKLRTRMQENLVSDLILGFTWFFIQRKQAWRSEIMNKISSERKLNQLQDLASSKVFLCLCLLLNCYEQLQTMSIQKHGNTKAHLRNINGKKKLHKWARSSVHVR